MTETVFKKYLREYDKKHQLPIEITVMKRDFEWMLNLEPQISYITEKTEELIIYYQYNKKRSIRMVLIDIKA